MEEGKKVVSSPVDGDLEHAISSNWAYDHAADLEAHTKNPLEVFRTGEYVILSLAFPAAGTFVFAANTLYAIPFLVPRPMTFDMIAVNVKIAAALSNIRLGIYNNGTNLYPGTKLLDAGVVSGATTGVKAITITGNQKLTKGIYWLVAVSDGIPYVVRYENRAMSILGVKSTDFYYTNSGWLVAFTYAALPNPFTAGGAFFYAEDARGPQILLRLLSLD